MTETNVDYAVLVIGDEDTVGRMEVLAAKAAESGARIADTFAFPVGAAASNEDLAEVEAVVAALSRAVATRTCLWAPFPLQDLCREQHIRRLSAALQRHGLNLLMGQHMSPCPTEGGYSAIDAALREEVRAVDDLDRAALARSASRTLGAEIEEALAKSAGRPQRACRGERIYSTREAAGFLGQPINWISWALRQEFFTYADDSPIEPLRIGRGKRRRFTVSMLKEMAKSCHRHGVLNRRECERVLAELSRTER
jgi:hypothetical protein